MVLAVHVGSDAKAPDRPDNRPFKGPGGAVMNYVESSYSGQRMATMMVACGALDRHPDLRLLISEGGATWVPFIADRIEEGYRQRGVWVRPKLRAHPARCIRAGLCLVPARRRPSLPVRRWATAMSCSVVTTPSRGNVRPYPKDVARTVRRRGPRHDLPDHPRRIPRLVPRGGRTPGRRSAAVVDV